MQNDNDTGAIAYVILLIIVLWLLYAYNDKILAIWQFIFVGIGHVVAWIASTDLGAQLVVALKRDPAKIQAIPAYIATLDAAGLKKLDYMGAKQYGDYLHRISTIVIGPALIYFGMKLHKHSSMDSAVYGIYVGVPAIAKQLAKGAGRYWMSEVKDLSKVPLYEGPMSLQAPITPWRFAVMYNLVTTDEFKQVVTFDMQRAISAYEKTLGRRFKSIAELEAGPLGEVWRRVINQLPAKEHKTAGEVVSRGHIYEKTVIISLMLAMGRTQLVDAAPLQAVTRYKDLAMFDAICSVGRRTAFAAGGAIMAQYRYERAIYNSTSKKGALTPDPGVGAIWAARELEEAVRTDPMEMPWCEESDIWKNFDSSY
ncbi:hypothetical protein [Geopseudomonas aromaticivorans]